MKERHYLTHHLVHDRDIGDVSRDEMVRFAEHLQCDIVHNADRLHEHGVRQLIRTSPVTILFYSRRNMGKRVNHLYAHRLDELRGEMREYKFIADVANGNAVVGPAHDDPSMDDTIDASVLRQQLTPYADPDCRDCEGCGVYYRMVCVCNCILDSLPKIPR